MRELTVRLQFTTHCLGNVRKHYRTQGKLRSYYVLPKNPAGKVIFMPTWWAATLTRAAQVLCRHFKAVKQIHFAMEVEGNPRPIPEQLFRRYFGSTTFSSHEAFFPGDIISVTCVVPAEIDDDDFRRLLTHAGKYWGMSPGHPNKFGYYVVDSITPTVPKQISQRQMLEEDHNEDVKKDELATES